jgi:hypothetical protein
VYEQLNHSIDEYNFFFNFILILKHKTISPSVCSVVRKDYNTQKKQHIFYLFKKTTYNRCIIRLFASDCSCPDVFI